MAHGATRSRIGPLKIDRPADPEGDALVARVVAGDRAAFSVLVQRFGPILHRIAYRMLADGGDAEDVAQDALLRLWTLGDRWQSERAGVAPWLKRVTINLCFDRLRRRKFTSDAPAPERTDETPAADEALHSRRLQAATLACVQGLAERQRAAIVLTYYEEMPNASAAAAMDMQIKAFESLVHRARQALRDALLASGLIDQARDGTWGERS